MDTPEVNTSSRVPIPTQTTQKPKKPHSFFKLTAAFLLGALVYAVVAGAYSISHRQAGDDQTTTTQQATPVTPNTSVSQDDLKKYVTPLDCTTKSSYTNLTSLVSLGDIQMINLYDGITVQNSTGGGTYQWKTLPNVVDYKCNVIKITDIEKGDRVNIYVNKTDTYTASVKNIQLIQKANL